jgi:hypothetical protein
MSFAGLQARCSKRRAGQIGIMQSLRRFCKKFTKVPTSPTLLRVVYGERSNPALAQPLIDLSARNKQLRAPFPAVDIFAPT